MKAICVWDGCGVVSRLPSPSGRGGVGNKALIVKALSRSGYTTEVYLGLSMFGGEASEKGLSWDILMTPSHDISRYHETR